MPKCNNCGAIYEEGAKYCPQCGNPIEEEETEDLKDKGADSKKEKGLNGIVKFAILVMVVGFFIALISFLVDNGKVAFGGIETFIVGLVIFIASKWKSKKAYLTAIGLFASMILFNVGLYFWQHREVEIGKIIDKRCKFCSEVVKSDTNTIKRLYIDVKNKEFLHTFEDTICDSCRNSAEGIFNEGKREYWQGDYDNALIKFRAASQRQYQQATEWITKTKEAKRKKDTVEMSSIDYSFLRKWKPNDNPNGFGAEILLKQDLNKQEIISFIKQLSKNKDPVMIKIYTSREAYQQQESGNYGEEYGRGFLLFYIKNYTGEGAYQGFNEIRWMQETGKFSHLFGEKKKL